MVKELATSFKVNQVGPDKMSEYVLLIIYADEQSKAKNHWKPMKPTFYVIKIRFTMDRYKSGIWAVYRENDKNPTGNNIHNVFINPCGLKWRKVSK